MITVRIKGPTAFVECGDQDRIKLDKMFTFQIPQSYFINRARRFSGSGWDGKAHFFSRITGRIPTGLVGFIERAFDNAVVMGRSDLPLSVIKRRIRRVKRLSLKGIVLSDFQREAIKRAVITLGGGILEVATNGGKTEIAAGIIRVINKPTLYVVHRKELLHQVADRIKLRTGIKCGKIGDGLKKIRDVTVAMVQSLPRPNRKSYAFYNQFKVLVMDEAQHSSASTWYRIARFMSAPYKYSMSGTPWTGNDIKDVKLISCFGDKILARVKNQQLIKSGWSATPTIHIWPVKCKQNGQSWFTAYQSMVVDNEKYNEGIIDIAKRKWEQGMPVLVLVNRINHGVRLYRRLIGEGIDCKFLSGSSQSIIRRKALEKFREGKLSTIVAAPIFDEGVDVPAIRCLILAGGGKAPITLLQRVGRALRKKKDGSNTCQIHDFFIFGNSHLESHSLQRIGVYEREGFDIKYHHRDEFDPAITNQYFKTGEIDWHKFHKEEVR